MGERELILQRIREGLKVKAPRPGAHGEPLPPPDHPPGPVSGLREWLPPVGDAFEERLSAFAQQSAELKTEFFFLSGEEEALGKLQEVTQREGWKRLASHGGSRCAAACARLGLPVLRTDQSYAATELEQCDAGISECDALVAQTGSVLVTSRSAGGRALSVLPPHHVVLAGREQLLRDLPDAFALLKSRYGSDYPSFLSVITGPSRTGDIERILVLGAHGPRKLTVICW